MTHCYTFHLSSDADGYSSLWYKIYFPWVHMLFPCGWWSFYLRFIKGTHETTLFRWSWIVKLLSYGRQRLNMRILFLLCCTNYVIWFIQTSSKTISKLAHPNAPLGYLLCFLNLMFDGFTNATQDSITARYFSFLSELHLLPFVWF